jgi:hypothetical protein
MRRGDKEVQRNLVCSCAFPVQHTGGEDGFRQRRSALDDRDSAADHSSSRTVLALTDGRRPRVKACARSITPRFAARLQARFRPGFFYRAQSRLLTSTDSPYAQHLGLTRAERAPAKEKADNLAVAVEKAPGHQVFASPSRRRPHRRLQEPRRNCRTASQRLRRPESSTRRRVFLRCTSEAPLSRAARTPPALEGSKVHPATANASLG